MIKSEFLINIKKLSNCYIKDLTEEQILMWYEYFKNTNIKVFEKAVDDIIKESKYFPSIKELLDKCEEKKQSLILKIIDKMKVGGYFKNQKELDKIYKFIDEGIIPSWFREDMKEYYMKEFTQNDKKLLNL